MNKNQVTVRMYRIGFGDAFLLSIPNEDGNDRKVLIDCGRHFQTPSKTVRKIKPPPKEADIVERIIKDVSDAQGKARIDLVIATHRHQDHVSGFSSTRWASVAVKEVWMPWTEHPTDPDAIRIRRSQSALAKRLQADAQRLGVTDPGFLGLVANSLSNEPAMKTLHQGFSGRPRRRFLEGRMQTLRPKVLPGVRVHVLGPARDKDVIRDMDPPTGQSYLRARAITPTNGNAADDGPFGKRFALSEAELAKLGHPHLVASKTQIAHLKELASGDPFVVAAALEKAVNGTSLMLAFEIGSAMLLFPGDAQWGTWKRALESAKARGILERTSFYKIGHHGSHNATPKDFVEQLLGDDFCAMASVWPVARFPKIPKTELMQRLLKKNANVARADAPPVKHFKHDDEVVWVSVPIG